MSDRLATRLINETDAKKRTVPGIKLPQKNSGLPKLTLPIALDKQTKDLIKRSYVDAVKDVGEDEYLYIARKILDKIENTKTAATAWIQKLSSYYETLYFIFENHNSNNESQLSGEAIRLICAALFYFVNPFDVIPDYVPGTGYADDLLVFNICIESLSHEDRKIIIPYYYRER